MNSRRVNDFVLMLCFSAFLSFYFLSSDGFARPHVTIPLRTQNYDLLLEFAEKYSATDLQPRTDGKIENVRGRFSEPVEFDQFEETAISFLEMHAELFGMISPRTELTLEEIDSPRFQIDAFGNSIPPARTTLEFSQCYRGLPVYGARVLVAFNANGELTRIWGNFCSGIDVSVNAAISAHDAAMWRGLEGTPADTVFTARLLIYRSQLAWYIESQSAGQCFIDAHCGAPIHCLPKYEE